MLHPSHHVLALLAGAGWGGRAPHLENLHLILTWVPHLPIPGVSSPHVVNLGPELGAAPVCRLGWLWLSRLVLIVPGVPGWIQLDRQHPLQTGPFPADGSVNYKVLTNFPFLAAGLRVRQWGMTLSAAPGSKDPASHSRRGATKCSLVELRPGAGISAEIQHPDTALPLGTFSTLQPPTICMEPCTTWCFREGKLRHRALMAALLRAAAGRSHWSLSADSDLRVGSRLGFLASLGCAEHGLWSAHSRVVLAAHPTLLCGRCQGVTAGVGDKLGGWWNQGSAASPVQGSPVLVPVLLPGRVQPGEPGSPSILMPDINFHSFQYFMSVTIKKKKKKRVHHSLRHRNNWVLMVLERCHANPRSCWCCPCPGNCHKGAEPGWPRGSAASGHSPGSWRGSGDSTWQLSLGLMWEKSNLHRAGSGRRGVGRVLRCWS